MVEPGHRLSLVNVHIILPTVLHLEEVDRMLLKTPLCCCPGRSETVVGAWGAPVIQFALERPLVIRHYERLVVRGRRRLIQPNWWMLPAVVFVVWRAIDEDRFWLYLPIGLAGIILGIWFNTRRSDDPQAGSMGE